MWIFLTVVAVLWFLLWMAVHIQVGYESEGELTLSIRYLFLRFRILPMKEKPQPEQTPQPEPAKQGKPPKNKREKKESKVSISDLLAASGEILNGVLPRVSKFLRSIVVEKLCLNLAVGGEDAGDAAHSCGKLAGAVYTAYATAQNVFTLRPADIHIVPNYLENRTWVKLFVSVRIRPSKVLGAAVSILAVFLYQFLRAKFSKTEQPVGEEPIVE